MPNRNMLVFEVQKMIHKLKVLKTCWGGPGPHFGGVFDDFRVDFGVILESFFNVFLCWNPLVSWWRCYGIALVLL